jgi:hypothetical protein
MNSTIIHLKKNVGLAIGLLSQRNSHLTRRSSLFVAKAADGRTTQLTSVCFGHFGALVKISEMILF